MILKVPYKCGISVKCLHCKHTINVNNVCGENKKNIKKCMHTNAFRYNLTVCIPGSITKKRRMKILDTPKFEIALVEMEKFKASLKAQGYHKVNVNERKIINPTLLDHATAYLNSMTGEDTPAILIRLKSQSHIDDCERSIFRFIAVLKKGGYNYENLLLQDITDTEVSLYHEYLLGELKLKSRSYNKHISAIRTLYNWAARVKDYKGSNPFNHVELRNQVRKEKNIITKDEFEKLLNVVTYENGFDARKKNLWKPWLKMAYRLGLETGLRREELFMLSWQNLIKLDSEALVFKICNLKVNRMFSGDGDGNGNSMKYVPVTKSLMTLLVELGYPHKTEGYIIERPEGIDLKYLLDNLSRSFSHFIVQATSSKLEFKDLRKFYITRIVQKLGPSAKLFTGHTNDATLTNHYLSAAFLAGNSNLSEFNIF